MRYKKIMTQTEVRITTCDLYMRLALKLLITVCMCICMHGAISSE